MKREGSGGEEREGMRGGEGKNWKEFWTLTMLETD